MQNDLELLIREFPDKPWRWGHRGLSYNRFNYKKKLEEYNENTHALLIQKRCWNWLNKIECKDHTYGIRPRIDLTKSGLFGDLRYPNHMFKGDRTGDQIHYTYHT